MKNLAYLLILAAFCGYSQSISKSVIGAAGKTQANGLQTISWTTGEPVVGTMTNGGVQLGNGYYNSLNVQELDINDHSIALKLLVYPNPTSDWIRIDYPEMIDFTVIAYDLKGVMLFNKQLKSGEALDFASYAPGVYILNITSERNAKPNTYKIIKR